MTNIAFVRSPLSIHGWRGDGGEGESGKENDKNGYFSMSQLEIINIHKNYEGKPLLKGINLTVSSGETLCLLGRSGSGKSTLLRIVAGLESADRGDLLWNGESICDVPTWQRQFGLMFQDYALFPHMNVSENVAFGLRMAGMKKVEIAPLVNEALELVNMSAFGKRQVTDLSGGEQQRIALARALAPHPRLLMLDEPLAALDRALRLELQDELRGLLHKTGIPAIYVTHDQEEAFVLGDRVAILSDGLVEQSGSPEEVYQAPKNRSVAEFLGMTNFVDGKVVATEPLQVETALGILTSSNCRMSNVKIGDQQLLLVQTTGAELATTQDGNNRIHGIVTECFFRGDDFKVTLNCCELFFEFSLSERCEVGQSITIQVPDSSVVCLET
jgi:ABC-type Fe3+/spermidine/putrescine transport system ATPase subunit